MTLWTPGAREDCLTMHTSKGIKKFGLDGFGRKYRHLRPDLKTEGSLNESNSFSKYHFVC